MQNLENIVEAYKVSVLTESQKTLQSLLEYAQIERARLSRNDAEVDVGGPMGFIDIAKGDGNISPEDFSKNFLESLFLFIL